MPQLRKAMIGKNTTMSVYKREIRPQSRLLRVIQHREKIDHSINNK
jgi:hypothetical protein